VILRFLHGWALDGSVWAKVVPLLAEFDCRVDDRGYFGPSAEVAAGEIAVGHSFGAMRALAAPGGMRALVAVAGFDCFAARDDFPGTPARVIERMERRFEADPAAVVAEFRARCGLADSPPIADAAALRADLAALRAADRRGAARVPVTLLHAADDPIVPPAMAAAVFAGAAERITLSAGGHLLPLTAPEACASAIRAAARRLA
jgi:pimeloyl-[acyl-carrier protein] methyl ester esterase